MPSPGNCWSVIGPGQERQTCAALNGTFSTDGKIPGCSCYTPRGFAASVAWTPDGKRLVSFGKTHPVPGHEGPESFAARRVDVKLWDVATRRQLPLRLDGLTDTLFDGCLSPDGKLLAAHAAIRRCGSGTWKRASDRHTGRAHV